MNTDDLNTRLARESDRFYSEGGTPLEISQVLDRAGEIKRGRRMRASMLMAACVLAIAVPTVLVATNDKPSSAHLPAKQIKVDDSPLTLEGLGKGEAPGTGYIQDGKLTLDGFTYASQAEKYAEFAQYKGGVMVAVRDDQGNLIAHSLDSTIGPRPMEGGFAVSESGDVVAFVEPDGTPVVVQNGATYDLAKVPRGSGFSAVAVTGEGCDPAADGTGCSVWVQSRGRKPEAWVSTSAAATVSRTEFKLLSDVRGGELMAGMTAITDDGSCSAVQTFDADSPLWGTCDYSIVSFSPDGAHVLAGSAYYDGLGDSRLAVLDTGTGKPVLDLRTADEAVVGARVWEDDSHLLVTVYQQGRFAVLRVGLDGSREFALAPVTDSGDYATPFGLAAR